MIKRKEFIPIGILLIIVSFTTTLTAQLSLKISAWLFWPFIFKSQILFLWGICYVILGISYIED